MKALLLISLLFIELLSCKRNAIDESICTIKGDLTGKWEATEQFSSPGAGDSWNLLASDKRFTIEFKSDSSFIYSANFPKTDFLFSKYTLLGSAITISSSVNSNRDTWYYNFDNQCRLNLSIFLCIEGCPYRLIAVK